MRVVVRGGSTKSVEKKARRMQSIFQTPRRAQRA
jgi:hypothetical protein